MVDAGIKDLSADPQTILGKIEEKFRLDLTVEQAEHYFVSLINESLTALAPQMMEVFHRIAVARR
jgi:phosphatidylinositol 3-kinase